MPGFVPSDTLERALGPTEEMYWRFDALSPLNFGVTARIRGPLDMGQLREAIDAVQRRHPLLRVHVECDSNDVPWFREGVGPIRLVTIDAPPHRTWPSLERALNYSIETKFGPMLYFVLIRHAPEDATLQIIFHHAISDGRSATFLVRDLLQSLAQQARGESPDLVPLPPAGYYGDRIPAFDPLGSIEKLRTAWKTVKAAAFFVRGIGLPVGLHTSRERGPQSSEHRILVEPRFLEREELARVLERARRESTTLQCVLNAALSLSVAEDSPTRRLQRTSCTQVVDIRARLEPPVGEDCGLFATGLTSLHQAGHTTDFWPFAREIRKHMDQSISTPLPFFHAAVHGVVSSLVHGVRLSDSKRFSEIMNSIHPEGLAVSNLGRVTISVEGSPVQITDFAFATNTSVLNDLSTSAVTFGGRLTWAFNGSAVLTRARLARVADRAMTMIAQAVESP